MFCHRYWISYSLVTPAQQRRKMDGRKQKRRRMKSDSDISRPSPMLVTSDAKMDEWFVVKVINFDEKTKKFEVLDEEAGDDEEGGVQKTYKLSASCIIPFPERNDPSGTQEFPAGRNVLAVYPETTALYKATVISTPRKYAIYTFRSFPLLNKLTNNLLCAYLRGYLLEFDDGALPQRTVPFHKVVPLPEWHRQ
ncbi:hypothetical protein ES288_D07G274100v1 [Gossypium darwinii]|uniref:SGF29 C-terminal domain-containing protein n=1 Tax=Gossypium darwinii TaxID=34276 RepID=A0A5D2C570_GOSDA|nr:hypothetical protein ES288_D07G274100v1 [Gossypium darwinii]